MAEVQRHGFDFENWVKEKFFADFKAVYTQKWIFPVKQIIWQKFRRNFTIYLFQ